MKHSRLLFSTEKKNLIFVGAPKDIDRLAKAFIGVRLEKITTERGVRGHRLTYIIFDEAKI